MKLFLKSTEIKSFSQPFRVQNPEIEKRLQEPGKNGGKGLEGAES
jgi:hypothetical protein